MRWIAIAVGGALGSLSRWSIAVLLANSMLTAATLFVNATGSLALGILFGRFTQAERLAPVLQGVGSGFLGGYTTMSAFGLEAWILLADGRWVEAILYTAVSAAVGPWLAHIGLRIGGKAAPPA
jgi:CrcB protein